MNVDYRLIGSRIKSKRKQNKKTQEQLAEEMSVSVGYISQLERGITKTNLETLAKLSRLLNCNISYFVSDSTIGQSEYLHDEFVNKFSRLDKREKRIALDLIESIIKNRE